MRVLTYFTKTNGITDIWKRLLAVLVLPIWVCAVIYSLISSIVLYLPILLVYWIITGNTFSFSDMLDITVVPIC